MLGVVQALPEPYSNLLPIVRFTGYSVAPLSIQGGQTRPTLSEDGVISEDGSSIPASLISALSGQALTQEDLDSQWLYAHYMQLRIDNLMDLVSSKQFWEYLHNYHHHWAGIRYNSRIQALTLYVDRAELPHMMEDVVVFNKQGVAARWYLLFGPWLPTMRGVISPFIRSSATKPFEKW